MVSDLTTGVVTMSHRRDIEVSRTACVPLERGPPEGSAGARRALWHRLVLAAREAVAHYRG